MRALNTKKPCLHMLRTPKIVVKNVNSTYLIVLIIISLDYINQFLLLQLVGTKKSH